MITCRDLLAIKSFIDHLVSFGISALRNWRRRFMYVFLTVNIISVVLSVIQENKFRLRRVRLEVGLLRIG